MLDRVAEWASGDALSLPVPAVIAGLGLIIAAFAFVLGGGNLLRIHLTKISRRDHEWLFSVVTVAGFVVMLFVGLTMIATDEAGGIVFRPGG